MYQRQRHQIAHTVHALRPMDNDISANDQEVIDVLTYTTLQASGHRNMGDEKGSVQSLITWMHSIPDLDHLLH